MKQDFWNATLKCRDCGAVLNTAKNVAEYDKALVSVSSGLAGGRCPKGCRSTASDLNLNTVLEWECITENGMRQGFSDIVSGWMLIDGMEDISYRIEEAAKWTEQNGPLFPAEEATIKMIESQIARGIKRGDFEPFISGGRA